MTAEATVISPFSWASPAIELGNRQWRKKILPVGDVSYKGRTLHFTEDYLRGLEEAFRDRAYDQVSFQLADSGNSHTNDPERHRGTITDMRAEQDGLYITLNPTERGEEVLRENPYLGVSARIVEHYARSDGKYYDAAVQHVLGTLDPRIPALGAWAPVDMSGDGGQVIIDLSNSAWDNEPGPSFDLAYSAVGARLGAGNNVSAGNVDSPAWSYDDGNEAALAEFARTFDLANETELARLEQDAEPLAARTEDRIARAMDRIEAGTFTPQGQFAREFANSARSGLTDDLGYSIERYPQVGSATPDIVEALRPQLEMIAHRPFLGEDGQVWFDQQFGSPMTLLDHIEAASGIRLGDASLFETGRTRREVAAVQRPQVFGDPDDPDNMPLGIPAGTARTAAALAAQAGIATTASHQEQQAAAVREHDRQAARYRGPRHPDYRADLSNPAPRETGLAAFGDAPWNGSLPVYTRGAA